jgi:hypothetical protein
VNAAVAPNIGPLVLTLLQFAFAGAGYLLVVTVLPSDFGNPRLAVLVAVVVAAATGTLFYRRSVRPRLPAALLGGDDDFEERPPDGLDAPGPGALGPEDIPGPDDADGDGGATDDRPEWSERDADPETESRRE